MARGRFPGMGGNMGNMMKQMQKKCKNKWRICKKN